MARLLRRHTARVAAAAWGHIVYVTEDRDFLASELGVAPQRIAVVPAAAPEAMTATPAPPMTPQRLRTIAYVSQFAFFKAPMIVAEAMSALAQRHEDLRLVWLCDRSHHDAVRALFAPSVVDRVELLSWVPQDELRAVYDRAGVFLFPSFYEGFGKVFIEAMARGAAVVATDIAGARDVIVNGRDGILVPPGDAAAVFDAAEELLRNPESAVAMSAAAARRAREYTWTRAARETAAFYERLIKMGPP
jgi:glycosyltransferase involved in cell wall biosynthesis